MLNQKILSTLVISSLLALAACAPNEPASPQATAPAATTAPAVAEDTALDEIDPYAADIEEQMALIDEAYAQETGLSPFLENLAMPMGPDCYRAKCPIWVRVVKSEQRLYLYRDGNLYATWATSTGIPGRGTPNFDMHPNGRIYDKYTSTKFPGGDYKGLGNMPYAVFIKGGFAIHGTSQGNWKKLGKPASHGCIRIHPENAYTLNRLVRQYGIYKVWITVQ